MKENMWGIFDSLCEMKTASLEVTSGWATVDGTQAYFDTGGGFTKGLLVIDVSACSSATTPDLFEIRLQGSNTAAAAFTAYETLAKIQFGNINSGNFHRVAVGAGGKDGTSDRTTGRFIIPWTNMMNGTVYRYLRLYHAMNTPATGINYTAFLTQDC